MKPMLPEGLERTLITPFLVMFSPLTEADKSELGRLCRENHDYFMDQVNQHGGILLAGAKKNSTSSSTPFSVKRT